MADGTAAEGLAATRMLATPDAHVLAADLSASRSAALRQVVSSLGGTVTDARSDVTDPDGQGILGRYCLATYTVDMQARRVLSAAPELGLREIHVDTVNPSLVTVPMPAGGSPAVGRFRRLRRPWGAPGPETVAALVLFLSSPRPS